MRNFFYVEDVKLIFLKNGYYYLYICVKFLRYFNVEEVFDIFDFQKRGFLIFEKGMMICEESFFYVVCEENLVFEVILVIKRIYNVEVVSIEDYMLNESIFLKFIEK